jgi:hypothetical protein
VITAELYCTMMSGLRHAVRSIATRVSVGRTDLVARVDELMAEQLAQGEVRLSIAKWSFTANNITYGVAGDTLRYWDFFPTACDEEANRGVIPVWGVGDVRASRCDGVHTGQRVYGYFPMAEEVKMRPERISARSFVDATPHRAELPAAYNEYTFVAQDPFYSRATEDRMLVLRPLFFTSWLLDDFLAGHSDFGARSVILSSASSKTAIGVAYMLRDRPAGRSLDAIGLTSEANREFVEGLGLYSRVVTYEALHDGGLEGAGDTVYIDMAGSVQVLEAVHGVLGVSLKHSCSVGLSHRHDHDGGRPPPDLVGPRPKFFFAPEWIRRRAAEQGGLADVLQAILPSWHGFVEDSGRWLSIAHLHGPDAVLSGYASTAAGRGRPSVGTIMSL